MRQRIRMIKMLSILIGSVLLSTLLTFFIFGVYQKNKLIAEHEKEIEKYKIDLHTSCYVVKKDVEANAEVQVEDLQPVRVPKELYTMELVADTDKLKEAFYSQDLKKGTVLYKNMVYHFDGLASDLRKYEISSLLLPSGIEIGDYVDVRIKFPNGLDYVVLAKKKLIAINKMEESELCTLHLDSQEILRLSSALVDAYLNEETELYSTVYLDPGSQRASEVTYPSNPSVAKLLKEDANILSMAKERPLDRSLIPGEGKKDEEGKKDSDKSGSEEKKEERQKTNASDSEEKTEKENHKKTDIEKSKKTEKEKESNPDSENKEEEHVIKGIDMSESQTIN
ncbi:MAG: hypothetical protein Q4A72_06910 [Bacillota bacterium]|nr:hypothetical protein [Bacillota bacterium]